MTHDESFLIDRILPANQIHLITGPSGAGKTTLGLQMLRDWAAGDDVFDFPSHPAPFCFVACNRPLAALRSHMKLLGIPVSPAFPHLSLVGRREPDTRTFHYVLTAALNRVPNLSLLFLDSLSTLCPGRITDDRTVDDFLSGMAASCEEKNITVLGTIRSVKALSGSGYLAARERIIGSGAFSAATGTKFIVEPLRPSQLDNPQRVLGIVPALGKPTLLSYAFDDSGALERQASNCLPSPLDNWLGTIEPGNEFTSDDLKEAAKECGVTAKSTLYDWIKTQLELGIVVRGARGEYRVPERN